MSIKEKYESLRGARTKYMDVVRGPDIDLIAKAFAHRYDENIRIDLGFTILPMGRKEGSGCLPLNAKDFRVEMMEYDEDDKDLAYLYGKCRATVSLVRHLSPYTSGVIETQPCYYEIAYKISTNSGTIGLNQIPNG